MFKLAIILTFHCVPFILCRVSLIFFLTSFIRMSYFSPHSKLCSHPFCIWNLELQKNRMKSSLCKTRGWSTLLLRGQVARLHIHTLRSCFLVAMPHLRYQSISSVFLFVSRYIYADPLHCNMTYLFIRLLKDDLKEYTYAAHLSGLSYAIASGMNAILVSKCTPEKRQHTALSELSVEPGRTINLCISK